MAKGKIFQKLVVLDSAGVKHTIPIRIVSRQDVARVTFRAEVPELGMLIENDDLSVVLREVKEFVKAAKTVTWEPMLRVRLSISGKPSRRNREIEREIKIAVDEIEVATFPGDVKKYRNVDQWSRQDESELPTLHVLEESWHADEDAVIVVIPPTKENKVIIQRIDKAFNQVSVGIAGKLTAGKGADDLAKLADLLQAIAGLKEISRAAKAAVRKRRTRKR